MNFIENLNQPQKETRFKTYTQDNHVLIPLYLGTRIFFHSNKLFSLFASFDVGYSYLSYNSYHVVQNIDPDIGVVEAYDPDHNSKTEVNENLIGLNLGAGITRELSKSINFVLFYKINTQLNSKYYDFLSSEATYSVVNLGVNFGF